MKVDEGKTIPIPKMASSLSPSESNPPAVSSNADTSSPSSPVKITNIVKAKSCKGCLYYSSRLKENYRNPVCVGLTRSLPTAPQYIVGELEMEAHKAGRSLKDFRYGCLGHSVYVDVKEQGNIEGDILPLCAGFEVLGDQLVTDSDSGSAPMTHIHNRQDRNGLPQRRSPNPTNSTGQVFLSRFTRNANVVAKGISKNMRRAGNQIKHRLVDVLYPHSRRPK